MYILIDNELCDIVKQSNEAINEKHLSTTEHIALLENTIKLLYNKITVANNGNSDLYCKDVVNHGECL